MTRIAGLFLASCCSIVLGSGAALAQFTVTGPPPNVGRTFDSPNLDHFDYSLTIQRDLDLLRRMGARKTKMDRGRKTTRTRPRKPAFRPSNNFAVGARRTKPGRKTPGSRQPGTGRRPGPTFNVRLPGPSVPDRPVYVPPVQAYQPPLPPLRPAISRGAVWQAVPQPRSVRPSQSAAPVVASGRYRPREVLIALPSEVTTGFINELSQAYDIEPRDSLGVGLLGVRFYRFSIRGARSVPHVVAEIQADPRVGDVQPNYVSELQSQAASGPNVQYALASLNVPDALARATGQNITIAVIDTGVDMGHPELRGVITGSFDAIRNETVTAEPHGTAIAGIIGARGTLRGVAPAARLLAVRAFSTASGSTAGETDSLTLARAMDWAASHGAAIFNMSFAGPRDPLLGRLLDAAHDKGIVLVAAAGNGGPQAEAVWPGAHPEVIAVTAVDHADRLYAKANQGDYIAVAAPGVDILTASPQGSYGVTSGTSMAAAHVSGIVALALEANPGLDAQSVRDLLSATAHDLGPAGRDNEFGAGKANALDALLALVQEDGTRVAGDAVPQ